jgi:uncharacterized glyoxalase superfamily protein PhnB
MTDLILDQINLVCANLEDSIAFYRSLGLVIPEEAIWRTSSGAHHVEIRMENGFEFALDSQALAQQYNEGSPEVSAVRKSNVLSFRIATPAQVNTLYAKLIDKGYVSSQEPYNTFWGSRYAIVEDPDGNLAGLMSPPDPGLRKAPPEI